MKDIKYYSDDNNICTTKCPHDTFSYTDATNNGIKMPMVGSTGCAKCAGFVSQDKHSVKCKYDEIKIPSTASF